MLRCGQGRTVNPAAFAGHDLVVLFCPTGGDEAAREVTSYLKHAPDFSCRDAWLLIFADGEQASSTGQCPQVLADPNREAWIAFRNLSDYPESLDRGDGAVFFFSRGGALTRFWHGSGHVHEVLKEICLAPRERRSLAAASAG